MTWRPSAIVAAVIERNGQFLTVEELNRGRAVFTQPSGHLEDGESLLDAVVREVREETGWRFHPQALVGCYRWINPLSGVTQLRMTFCGEADDYDPELPLDDGILGTHWLSAEELAGKGELLRSPLVMRSLDDYLSGNRHPLHLLTDVD